jgi:prevent-host-death family protein
VVRIGVRELRQHASRYLSRVKAGETVEVTERGQLVALLVPPDPATSSRERLVASGRLIPAGRPLRLPPRVSPHPGTPDSGTVLDELRAERQ